MHEDEYNILKHYNFRDSIGHPLENCVDFRNIIDELNSLRVLQELTQDSDSSRNKIQIDSDGTIHITGADIKIP